MPELLLLLPELPDELRDEPDDLLLPLLLLLDDLEGAEAEDCLGEEDLADEDDLL